MRASGGGWSPRAPRCGGLPTRRAGITAGPNNETKKYNLRRGPRPAGPADKDTAPDPPSVPGPPRPRAPIRDMSLARRPIPSTQSPPPTNRGEDPGPVLQVRSPGIPCPDCDRTFQTKIGLGVHRRHRHPEQANADVNVEGVKKRWSAEELRLMAREEALARFRGGVRFINQHLMAVLPLNRTVEAIKGARSGAVYKSLVEQALRDLAAASGTAETNKSSSSEDGGDSDSSFHSAKGGPSHGHPPSGGASELTPSTSSGHPPSHPSTRCGEATHDGFPSAIRRLMPVVGGIQGFGTSRLVEIGQRLLDGVDVAPELCAWLQDVFPVRLPKRPRLPIPDDPVRVSKKQLRRREYARVQRLFKTNMSRAAREILDGVPETRVPDVEAMASHWGPFVSQESHPVPQARRTPSLASLEYVWHPVTCDEVTLVTIAVNSAPGIDGITARQWKAVPASVKALFFNIVLASGGFPPEMLISRTVFVPKRAGGDQPGDFRPISIASIVIRQLHRILAKRLREAGLVDARQRCLDDGCAENISVVASLLEDSRRRLREIHIVSLDVAKAFDAVSHQAISNALGRTGLPEGFTNYVTRLYASSSTVFEVEGVRSERFHTRRGVRQGDPLSSLLFCLVVDEVLGAVPSDVGYEIGGCRVNALAYADDIILVSSTESGMKVALRGVEARAREQGLSFNAKKCMGLSIVPAGKRKTYKVLADTRFRLAEGEPVTQLTPSQSWSYLGVDFRPVGPKRAGGTLTSELDRLTRAPLKPQQRLKVLRSFLIPRFYHALVLSGTTLGKLRALDAQVRVSLRRWLRLPHDTAIGYFHTPCRMGGLGIPSFATTVPGLLLNRLQHLRQSSSSAVRAVAESSWVEKRLSWAEHALTKDDIVLSSAGRREKWWAERLYGSVDGYELRECGGTSLSNWWIDAGSYGVPGRDYVQYHHVRANSLPTRIRTSRGIRRETREIQCRAGCRATETAAHVIQACHRTHGGRVKRHDAVCKVLASGLRDAGWTVAVEPRIQTSVGLRKPDLVARKDGHVEVIDAQIVSGATSLDDAHRRKVEYYSGNPDITRILAEDAGVSPGSVSYSSCTLSWRGVWSSRSAGCLLGLGLPRRLLCGITTRVLQGSHTNWVRWNRMTGIGVREGQPRVGVG